MQESYTGLIDSIESKLQNHIGLEIAKGIVFHGYKAELVSNPYPEVSTPVKMKLFVNAVNDDGDDSDIRFEEDHGYEAVNKLLEDLGLMDGTVFYQVAHKL